MGKTDINGYVTQFPVDYDVINIDDIADVKN